MAEVPNIPPGIIVAEASRDYRWRRFALVLFLFIYGIYSAYDGFIHYPNDNNEFHRKNPLAVNLPHPAYDIPFNQAFGIGLPLLAIVFLSWALYNSRGMYRFDGQTLSVPGHPEVPVASIRKIDRSKWDRKGIAYVHYQSPGNAKLAILRLDDFIYDRVGTDKIFAQLEALMEASKLSHPAAPLQ